METAQILAATTPATTHTPPRIGALDGLRGTAVLAVMAFHFWGFSGPHGHGTADRLLTKVLNGGWVGVDLFFVLSGFLITGSNSSGPMK